MMNKKFLYLAVIVFFVNLFSISPALAQRQTVDELKAEISEAPSDTQKVKLLARLAQKYRDLGQTTLAAKKLAKADKLADSVEYDYGHQLIYMQRAELFLVKRQADSARIVLEKAVQQYPNSEFSVKYYNLLATAYRFKGKDRKALNFYNKAIALSDSAKDAIMITKIRMNMATVYQRAGQISKALEQYLKGLKVAEASGDTMFWATTLNNLGELYSDQNQLDKAQFYLQKSLNLSRAVNFKVGTLRSSLNLGIAKSKAGEYNEALSLLHQALQLSAVTRPGVPPIQITHNIGLAYFKKGDLKKAEKYFKKSLQQCKAMNVMMGVYYNSKGLGDVASKKQNYEAAIAWYEKALAAAVKLKSPILQAESQKRLYELSKTQGSYQLALGYLEAYTSITDSLDEVQNKRMLAEFETKLNVHRQKEINALLKEKQKAQEAQLNTQRWLMLAGLLVIVLIGAIVFLLIKRNKKNKRINEILNEQKQELEQINEVKNKLFAVIAHDLRNPLAGVKGMLYLLREGDLSKNEINTLSEQLELSLEQNINTIENLLVWSRHQMDGLKLNSKAMIINPVIDEILDSYAFHAQQKDIKLINEISDEVSVTADEDIIRLVLRNLISNSLKFSENNGIIKIYESQNNGTVTFTVEDDGIGIPESQQKSIFKLDVKTRKGTFNESGSGLGLRLCKEFIEKQQGNLSFESEEGKGTSFHFSLPKAM